ncbi:carboxypeptidase-like regulatory domain-containing protein [Aureibacter tunicatorum]|uniref:Alpha-2-macroglobulin domain-containing protein n=1 Tax=Aureibacter tunicatorum TaxID=866807 RepID=A0AAE4BUX1_9BACT|nr:carboxypeptidase-like regulatory domain-containing protein [Aureibacter tunicatorum]MDR6241495.1 hypothetical protein [Aureibacter tunicatorum]BDD06662.1 hypothetical protein AUTU_41450 [Aureibacter tunicatorum]
MNKSLHILTLFFLCLINVSAWAQSKIIDQSRRESYETFIFKINNEQALYFHQEDHPKPDSTFFQHLIDSYSHDDDDFPSLAKGHYLAVKAKENSLEYKLVSVNGLHVKTFNNHVDMTFAIYDEDGNKVNDAIAKVDNKKVKFDPELEVYRLPKTNKQGLLSLHHEGMTTYYQIERDRNSSSWLKAKNIIVYNEFSKIFWTPFSYIYKSTKSLISYGSVRPPGIYYKTRRLFRKKNNYSTASWEGYILTDKPKYRKRDTVRVKAFLLDENKKPIEDKLKLYLRKSYYGTEKLISKNVKAYRPGGYSYEFILHDSLELKNDRSYYITLQGTKQNFRTEIYLEDYSLPKVKYSCRISHEKSHPNGEKQAIYLSAIDYNEMPVMDGKAEIVIFGGHVDHLYQKSYFLKDTLWKHTTSLDAIAETKITIPDSLFEQASINYDIEVKLSNSDRETEHFEFYNISYQYLPTEVFSMDMQKDSISFDWNENLLPEDHNFQQKVQLYTHIKSFYDPNIQSIPNNITLPYTVKRNALVDEYELETPEYFQSFNLDDQNIYVQTHRSDDTLKIDINNPSGISYHYYIYYKNNLTEKGFGDSDKNIELKSRGKDNYYFSLHYTHAGETKDYEYKIPMETGRMQIIVENESQIIPGKKSKVNISVLDKNHQAIPNADLTAHILTQQFEPEPVSVPIIKELNQKNRKGYNSHELTNRKGSKKQDYWNRYLIEPFDTYQQDLKFDQFKSTLGLDSVLYYDFLYPENGSFIYKEDIGSWDSYIMPFVSDNGNILKPLIVEINNKPVYYSETETPYIFPVQAGKMSLTIRVANYEVHFDEYIIEKGKKYILSLDPKIFGEKANEELTKRELEWISGYMFKVDKNPNYAYLKFGQYVQPLPPNYKRKLYGPYASYFKKSKYISKAGYEHEFYFEPNYLYQFEPRLIKMTSYDNFKKPKGNKIINHLLPLSDQLYTEEMILDQWRNEDSIKSNRIFIPNHLQNNSNTTYKGNGELHIEVSHQLKDSIGFYILTKVNDPSKTYIRRIPYFMNLFTGKYLLTVINTNKRVYDIDTIDIKPYGKKHVQINNLDSLPYEMNAEEYLVNLFERNDQKNNDFPKDELDEYIADLDKEEVEIQYNDSYNNNSQGYQTITGHVTDINGEDIIGANVIIKGTSEGTSTDIYGNYSLSVDLSIAKVLVFSSLGYATQEVEIERRRRIDVEITEDVQQLNGVVVTALGVSRNHRSLSSTVQVIESNSVSNALAGKVAGVQIISNTQTTNRLEKNAIINSNTIEQESDIKLPTLQWQNLTSKGRIRTNFSDVAHWAPELRTDENGKVSFEVKYPDNITGWKGFVYGIDPDNMLTGTTEFNVQSFLPVSANLSSPRFLNEGDSIYIFGKALNYTDDTKQVKSEFSFDGKKSYENSYSLTDTHLDSSLYIVSTLESEIDSLKMLYQVSENGTLIDGEERSIPVKPQGMFETNYENFTVNSDTVIDLKNLNLKRSMQLYVLNNSNAFWYPIAQSLADYPHGCNEQTASRLMGLLALEKIKNEKKYSRKIKKHIKTLLERQNDKGTWSWWGTGETSIWVTLHVIKILNVAEEAGYVVGLDKTKTYRELILQLNQSSNNGNSLRILHQMLDDQLVFDYKPIADSLEVKISKENYPSLSSKFDLIRLQQRLGQEIPLDTLKKYERTSVQNHTYWGSQRYRYWACYAYSMNRTTENLIMHQILKDLKSSPWNKNEVMRYMAEQHQSNAYMTTYEKAQWLAELYPDLTRLIPLEDKNETIIISDQGDTLKVDQPVHLAKAINGSKFSISNINERDVQLYFQQKNWIKAPEENTQGFEISHSFYNEQNEETHHLDAGEKARLSVNVQVKEDAEFVILEIPLPSGTEITEKNQSYWWRSGPREYFKDKVKIYYNKLYQDQEIHIDLPLLARYTGSFTVNPIKIEAMYVPNKKGNTKGDRINISFERQKAQL